jgi:hypothetical protein
MNLLRVHDEGVARLALHQPSRRDRCQHRLHGYDNDPASDRRNRFLLLKLVPNFSQQLQGLPAMTAIFATDFDH